MRTIRPVLLAAALLSLLVAACSQPSEYATTPQFGTSGNDSGNEISAVGGSIYLLGTWREQDKLFRFGRAGNFPWLQGLTPKPGDDEVGFGGVAQTAAGEALVLYSSSRDDYSGGGDSPTTYASYYLRKVAVSGGLVWERKLLNTTAIIFEDELGLEPDSSGNIYVALGGGESKLRKYSAAGGLLWQKAASGSLREMAVAPDGSVFTSEVVSQGESSSTTLVRYSQGGTRLWTKTVAFAVLELSAARASEVYLSGTRSDAYPSSVNYLAKYSVQGNQVWLKTLRQADYGWRADDLAADAQGSVVLALSDFYERGIVEKYTAGGSRSWSKTLDKPVQDVAVLGTLEIYVTGSSERRVNGVNHGLADGYLLRLSGSGNQVWIR